MTEIHTVEYDDLTIEAAEITLQANGYTLVATNCENDLKPMQYSKSTYTDNVSSIEGSTKWTLRFFDR